MCGIFGAVFGSTHPRDSEREQRLIERLFLLSESRGKEAAGLAIARDETITIYKSPAAPTRMLRSRGYRRVMRDAFVDGDRRALTVIGHSRLVTDGVRDINANNQPVETNGVVGVHNGIIVNEERLWRDNPDLVRHAELDSEILFALFGKYKASGMPLHRVIARTFAEIEGAASVATLLGDLDSVVLATNTGSVYYQCAQGGTVVFASEAHILRTLRREFPKLEFESPTHVRPGSAAYIDVHTGATHGFDLGGNGVPMPKSVPRRRVNDCSAAAISGPSTVVSNREVPVARLLERFPFVSMRDRLRRCTRCVLPETMPFVDFDHDGVCAYCRNYPPIAAEGVDALEEIVGAHRRRRGSPDCIVGVSGGRDSVYGLHYLKRELGLNPVAYTYDWGMVTDLARRNVSRICGTLGIEHIVVSADIPRKREFVRKNVAAWLARPSLATVPLLMAGDKAYFHYLNQAKAQVGVELSFLCENPYERTDFKTGFAGVAPFHDPEHVYTLPLSNKLQLLARYAREFAANPRYLNTSLFDTARAFAYYYLIRRRYHNLYRYVPWDESEVESTLLGEYGFERAEDTKSTWRIGDGTAAFYNYAYYAIAGLTENDTFRSNQVRNGILTREQALDRVEEDSRPRFRSIQWYLDTIKLSHSIEEVLETINRAPKLY